jgi:hypothetical protein
MPNKEQQPVASRRFKKSLLLLATVTCLLSSSGATCQRQMMVNPFAAQGPAAPQVLTEGASRDQIIAAVNQNSSRIHSLTVTGATITVPDMLGLPLLSGNIAAERPNHFRLTAGTAVTGQEIDLGSNDELFWLWVRRNQPPGVYYCRHAEFANSNIRQMMPVEPAWLLAALGMVDIDPASVFDGPLPRGDGTVELRTWLPSASGTLQRVIVIDARRAWVVEQHVYDQAGKTLLASAVAEMHRYYPVEQVSLPELVSIRIPTANMSLKINLGVMQINQVANDRTQMFTMPTFAGYQQFNLGGAAMGTPLPGQGASRPLLDGVVPASYPMYPGTGYPVTPASTPGTPTNPTSASANSLPIYGQKSPLSQPARRY